MRSLFVSAVLALSACGEPATPGAPARDPGAVVLGSTQSLPDWLLVARQRDCARDAPEAERCPLGDIHLTLFFHESLNHGKRVVV